MDKFDPVGKAQDAAQDAVEEFTDNVVDSAQEAAQDVVDGVTEGVTSTVRERPALLVTGLLVAGGLFLLVSIFSGGPIQFFERLFLPVRFVVDNEGHGGDWYTVRFTNPPQNYDPNNFHTVVADELLRRIESAERSIDVAAFDFDLTPIAEALIAAHERGVQVRWFTDDEHGLWDDDEPGGGQFALMQEAGIPVRTDQREPLMHNKFIVFDGEVVWTGSTNLTENGLFNNNNNVIIFESKDIADMYGREFEELWRGNSGGGSRSTTGRQRATLQGTPINVFFAPEDDAMDRLIPLVRMAEDEIRFLAFSFTHDGLGEELVRQSRRGVDVKGVFESRNTNDDFTELHRLACNGVDVRKDGNPGTMHHKVFIIDNKIVVTGSYNFSNNADNSNDENMVFLNNDSIAPLYREEFERVWAQAWEPGPDDVICR